VWRGTATVGKVPAWTRWWWRRRDIETGVEEERARDMNPTTVEEAVGEASMWTWRWSVSTQWLWRRGGGRGVSCGEMIPIGLGFKGTTIKNKNSSDMRG
jgi:hypothetical protein